MTSIISSVSYESEASEMDDIGASYSSVSSLNVPRPVSNVPRPVSNVPRPVSGYEKKPVGRTGSFPLEQVQKSNQQRRESETARQKLTEGFSGPKDVYDWWTDEVSEDTAL